MNKEAMHKKLAARIMSAKNMALKGDRQGLKLNEAVFYWSLT